MALDDGRDARYRSNSAIVTSQEASWKIDGQTDKEPRNMEAYIKPHKSRYEMED